MLVEFSLKPEKVFHIYGTHNPRKFVESRYFYSCPLPHPKFAPKFLSSHPRQKKITHSPRQHFFENLFPPAIKNARGNYNLPYQN